MTAQRPSRAGKPTNRKNAAGRPNLPPATPVPAEERTERVVPRWNRELRELWLEGRLLKRFKRPAANIELILNSFEELGWPDSLDNPLSGANRRRQQEHLHNAIQDWNRGQTGAVRLLLRRLGTGEALTWEVVREESAPEETGENAADRDGTSHPDPIRRRSCNRRGGGV